MPPPSIAEINIASNLSRVVREDVLTNVERLVLDAIAVKPGITNPEVSNIQRVHPDQVTRAIRKLIGLRWVIAREDTTDRRSKRFGLTPTGLDAVRDYTCKLLGHPVQDVPWAVVWTPDETVGPVEIAMTEADKSNGLDDLPDVYDIQDYRAALDALLAIVNLNQERFSTMMDAGPIAEKWRDDDFRAEVLKWADENLTGEWDAIIHTVQDARSGSRSFGFIWFEKVGEAVFFKLRWW